ncbi:hypothetical protein K4T82_06360 [Staphylococcus epidermidis]|jgi:ABC-type antimicrobial peptide transport system permease subunit|uniref:hypothetical protein n=2 Tax=Staphylococcus epidermidis TaxID=1282 RepID=UPI0009B53DC6|nr:hypothetical protein [Staphylococcus epidermidis]DAY83706.1 MAG TPA: hypothetical protein [Caudoviricetes sp.]MBM0849985.1 hypothetical protein [Staphylococcus epidermidis]MCG1095717.1 hypothetical protein [Staphylococcus epidermidis]MCG1109135.1 hypothetical protein [Staphylococcus epidermidis]MCG1124542.1 hypothetical protein [Staphylococcus epidermidis]
MKNNMKDLTLAEIVASVMTFSYGFREFLRGFFWVKEQDDVLDDSSFYLALHHIMPIWSWGIVVMLAGVIVMVAAIFVSSSDRNDKFSKIILVGGFMSAILYFLMTSASIYHAINWLTIVHMGLMSATGFVVSYIGGADLYARRK